MKKSLITLITTVLLIITIMLLFSGCTDNSNRENGRFTIVQNEMMNDIQRYIIFYDNETLIMYMYVTDSYSGGLTVMVDKDGKPLLYDKNKEKE